MKNANDAIQILKNFSLHKTKPRVLVLETFLKQNTALDYSILNKYIGRKIDRGTIYRTLYLFLEKGLLHTVPSADGVIHYILETEKNAKENNKHVHFICDKCNKLICLPGTPIPEIKISKNFKVKNLEVVLNGLCNECQQSN